MDSAAPVLTIDGPSGSGKGTISRIVAQRLGWHYLDSGALYRAVGVAAGWADLDLDDGGALVRCTFDTVVAFREDGDGELRVLINGNDATDELRTETAGAAASAIAAIPEVRAALKERQRAFRQLPGLGADGRARLRNNGLSVTFGDGGTLGTPIAVALYPIGSTVTVSWSAVAVAVAVRMTT